MCLCFLAYDSRLYPIYASRLPRSTGIFAAVTFSLHSVSRLSRALTFLLLLFYAGFFVALAGMRLAYPFEVEFLEGLMADHALRITQGLEIYVRPTMEFIPVLYTPFYSYASATAMEVVGVSLLAPRLVTLLATLGSTLLIGLMIAKALRSRSAALLGAGMFIATYGSLGFFFDVARVDSLFVALLLATLYALQSGMGTRNIIGSALCITLAFFTKQQALPFAVLIALWLLYRNWKQGLLWTALVGGLILAGIAWFNYRTDGWFDYYVFTVPRAKTAEFSWYSFANAFATDMFGMFAIAMLLAIATGITRLSTGARDYLRTWEGLVLLMVLGSSIVVAMSYGNLGGYKNVAMPLAAFLALIIPLAIWYAREREPRLESVLWLALLLQLIGLWRSPLYDGKLFASREQKAAGHEFIKTLRSLPGDVYVMMHGFLPYLAGKPMHAHLVSVKDVYVVNDEHARYLKHEYDSLLAAHAFGAIIIDEDPLTRPDSIPGYTLADRIFDEPGRFNAKLLDLATRPQFVFLPRTTDR